MLTDEPAITIHVTTPNAATARCGATGGQLITWEQATDPADETHFTCGACMADVTGGREPMGGSRP